MHYCTGHLQMWDTALGMKKKIRQPGVFFVGLVACSSFLGCCLLNCLGDPQQVLTLARLDVGVSLQPSFNEGWWLSVGCLVVGSWLFGG